MQSTPATLRDIYDMLLTSRGKQPRGLFEQAENTVSATARKAWTDQTKSKVSAIDWWTG